MKRGRIIALVGPDGSGKTTQSELLNNRLRESGLRTRLIYGRVVPVLSRPLVWAWAIRKRVTAKSIRSANSEDSGPRVSGIGQIVFIAAFRLDMLLQAIIKVRLGRIGRDVIVCDRYVHDSLLTDFAVQLGWTPERVTDEYWRLTRAWVPRPNLVIFLNVSPEVAMGRKHDILSQSAYRDLVRLYRESVFPDVVQVKIETASGIERAREDVWSAVEKHMGVRL